jgi:hypothetical protein
MHDLGTLVVCQSEDEERSTGTSFPRKRESRQAGVGKLDARLRGHDDLEFIIILWTEY